MRRTDVSYKRTQITYGQLHRALSLLGVSSRLIKSDPPAHDMNTPTQGQFSLSQSIQKMTGFWIIISSHFEPHWTTSVSPTQPPSMLNSKSRIAALNARLPTTLAHGAHSLLRAQWVDGALSSCCQAEKPCTASE